METYTDYSVKIKNIKGSINSLEGSLKNNGALDPDIQKVRKKNRYLENVKNTVDFFSKTGRLYRGRISAVAEQVQIKKEKFFYDEAEENKERLSLVEIGLMIIYAILAILMFCSWAKAGGYDINFKSIFRGAEFLNRFGSGSGGGAYSIMIFSCIGLVGCAVIYIIQIYNTYQRTESNLPYVGMLTVIVIWVMMWLSTSSWNSSFDEAMGYTPLRSELKGTAWFALILAITAAVIYNKSDEINRSLFGVKENVIEEITRELPVTNYYPWENIHFSSVALRQKEDVSFTVQYQLSKYISRRDKADSGRVALSAEFTADVFLKTPEKEYVITNCPLSVKYNKSSGETERIRLDRAPFGINEINDIKIVLKERRAENGGRTALRSISLDSGMNSVELDSYRKQNRWKEAVCREQKLEKGWICRCGLMHGKYEESCVNCSSAGM